VSVDEDFLSVAYGSSVNVIPFTAISENDNR
jgi:hypothetical protein